MAGTIRENVRQILAELPDGVQLVAAAKARTADQILEAIAAGVQIIGENYVQEAVQLHEVVGKKARWHFIGTLQKHNVRRRLVEIFDMIETVDSWEIAREIDKRCMQARKVMPALVEVNSGREVQKAGVLPENAERLIRDLSSLGNLRVLGLMTMGPRFGDPEASRPYFVETRRIFERCRELALPNVEMTYLSMGMTNSYRIALQEGANIVRIGTRLFGERHRLS